MCNPFALQGKLQALHIFAHAYRLWCKVKASQALVTAGQHQPWLPTLPVYHILMLLCVVTFENSVEAHAFSRQNHEHFICVSGQDFASPFFQLTPHDAHLGLRYTVGYEYLPPRLSPLSLKTCPAHNQNHQLNWWYAKALKGHGTDADPLRGIE